MSTWAAQTGLSELQKQKRKGGEGRKSKHGKLGEGNRVLDLGGVVRISVIQIYYMHIWNSQKISQN